MSAIPVRLTATRTHPSTTDHTACCLPSPVRQPPIPPPLPLHWPHRVVSAIPVRLSSATHTHPSSTDHTGSCLPPHAALSLRQRGRGRARPSGHQTSGPCGASLSAGAEAQPRQSPIRSGHPHLAASTAPGAAGRRTSARPNDPLRLLPRFVPPAGTVLRAGEILGWLGDVALRRDEIERLEHALVTRYGLHHVFLVSSARIGLTLLLQAIRERCDGRSPPSFER